ncbi:MAG TPA: hypothetical protein VHH73_11705 [Verrucomicrobiae bacterium]|nr:hypothetical protein [Verrucomicrobiae bacterium]
MNSWRDKFYKPLLWALIVVFLGVAGFSQRRLYFARETLGLTRLKPPENLPPTLAFTTVALGGFRGLIANALWIRASELQDQDKFFEMVQLADWITKLQPHIPTVWYHLAWNMAYNITVKFTDPHDRWLWVKRGVELLRDQALVYNPHDTILYRELSWIYQHKIGQNLDDAHAYYKEMLAKSMSEVFGERPNYDELLHPQTDAQRAKVKLIREKFRLDPAVMKEVDDHYGPLEWRLPEAHAIYWAWLGMKEGGPKDRSTLRRSIFQTMQLAFHRGRIIENKFSDELQYGPNLAIIPNANKAYEEMIEQDPELRENFKTGHKNFLLAAVYFLYTHNHITEANKYFQMVKEKYPSAIPPDISLDEYAVKQITEQLGETSQDKMKAMLEGYWQNSYFYLALGEDDQATGLDRLARLAWQRFAQETKMSKGRVHLPDIEFMKREALDAILDPRNEVNPQLVAQLRTRLGLGAPTNAPESTVPAPPANTAPPASPVEKK